MKNKILKIAIVAMCFVSGFIPKKVVAEEDTTSNSTTSISDFSIQTAETEYSPLENENNHIVKFTLSLTTSGDEKSVNSAKIELPKTLFNDRSGSVGDTFQVSIPTKAEYDQITSQGMEADTPWYYEETNDKVTITSTKPLQVGSTYNIEIGYQLNGLISNFKDGTVSNELTANVTLDTKGGTLKTKATADQVTLNTSVLLRGSRSDTESISAFTDEWDDSWGEKPADASNYFYSLVRVISYVTGSQPYNMSITSKAVDKDSNEEFTPYMYNIGTNGWTTNNTESNSTIFEGANGRKDYVLYRFPRNTYRLKETVDFDVTNTVHVQGSDLVDTPNDDITSTTAIHYEKEPWDTPQGHFIVLQNGDNYYRVHGMGMQKWSLVNTRIDKYSRYDLQNFQNGTLNKYDGLDFGYYLVGNPTVQTVPSGEPNIPENYFKENVTYNQFVKGISLVDGSTVDSDLTSDDYQIKTISLYPKYTKGVLNMSNKFTEKKQEPSERDVIGVYVKYNTHDSEYTHVADYSPVTNTYKNLKSGIESNGNKLSLDDNAVEYKLTFSNPYYITEMLSGTEYVLKHSAKIDNYVRDKEEIKISSNVSAEMLNSKGEQVYEYDAPVEYDYARKTETTSKITKEVSNVKNNRIKKRYELTWDIDVKETAKLSESNETLIEQMGGAWFDLMPAGQELDENTVKLIDVQTGKELSVEVSSTPNFKNTGRTLYKFTTNDTVTQPKLTFTTNFAYDSVRDYGENVYNPVVFETGNTKISNGTNDTARLIRYSKEMSNLTNDTGNRFIYAEKVYNLTTLIYFSSGLLKSVKNSTDSEYSRYTQVSQNEDYSYKLTLANSVLSSSKDVVLFDNLESYTTPSGETSNWKGILQSVDTTQISSLGFKPVVYASEDVIDLSSFSGMTTDEMIAKFRPLSDFSDYSNIKTIAVDCRKMQDGSKAELSKGKSLVAIVNMKAPESLPVGTVYKNYNNVYAYVTATESGAELSAFINNGYTTNTYKATGNMFVNKINSETKQGAKGIQFTLKGTSSYGEPVSMARISDANGLISFKKIPVGKYILTETDSTDDYFLDDTKHIVEIKETGEVLIDNIARSAITLENKPRINGTVTFTKKSYPNSVGLSVPIPDVEFTLQGTSDYGNDVLLTVKSDKDGLVKFKGVEKGTYKLYETKAPEAFIKSTDSFKVVIDSTGTATLTNVTENKNTDTVYNYRRLVEVEFTKINSETNQPIEGGYGDRTVRFTVKGQEQSGQTFSSILSINDKGVVNAEIPVGLYTVTENPNPKDKDGKSYMQDGKEYILEVKKDGTYTLDMEQMDGKYVVKNTPIATDTLIIRKKWVGGNPNNYIPKIKVVTDMDEITPAMFGFQPTPGENSGNTVGHDDGVNEDDGGF